MTSASSITILVPIYLGVDDVRRCVDSILRHGASSTAETEVMLIDDGSPEAEVREFLDSLELAASSMPVRVLRNQENLGFVATVNRGLRESSGDVVVLNADTIVTSGWLDRLAVTASAEGVATVTPLTNFGSICTLPDSIIEAFRLNSDEPAVDECADFIAAQSLELRPEVITGVGFCMYVTRESLDACGFLDEDAFGQGYGEEVDFCLRATRSGFRHLVEDSTFVFHRGAGSFGKERQARMAKASATLHDRYRYFRAANTVERSHQPLGTTFTALELGLSAQLSGDRRHVLHILHSAPDAMGGTEKHLRSLIDALMVDTDASILFPVESGFVLRTMLGDAEGGITHHEYLLPGGPRRVTKVVDEVAAEALAMALDMFSFDAVHIQNLIGHSLAPLGVLEDFSGPVVCSVRDLYLACPHHWLLYRNSQACGIPEDLSLCGRCLPETLGHSRAYLEAFREVVASRIDAVDRWVFASQSAADYLLRAYDIDPDRIEVIPHGAIIDLSRRCRDVDEHRIFDEPLRLAFVGMGWTKKGLSIVNQLAEDLSGSTVEIHHFGDLRETASPELQIHGPYDNERLPELLRSAGIQIVLLPGPYAETFGHVMTEAVVAGLPVIGTRYGALGERIRRQGVGWTVDPDHPAGVRELVENLDRCRLEVLRATERALAADVTSVTDTAERYSALYRAPKHVRAELISTGEPS